MATVQFFGKISDAMGDEISFSVPGGGIQVSDLRHQLALDKECADLAQLTIRVAVNDCFADEALIVGDADTITFFSPLSGG